MDVVKMAIWVFVLNALVNKQLGKLMFYNLKGYDLFALPHKQIANELYAVLYI